MRTMRNRHMGVLIERVLLACGKGRILDVGCGDGEAARFMAEHGCDVIATDPVIPSSLNGTHEVIGNGAVRWHDRDFLTIRSNVPFDAVCLFGVLHYARDAAHARHMLRHATHLLAPDGLLALTWITPDIPLDEREAFLPSRSLVSDTLTGFDARTQIEWSVEVEHTHNTIPLHRHLIAYAIWQMIPQLYNSNGS
jgi:SAM-dependent methyltransferase